MSLGGYAGAGALGARYGPRLIRSALDSERPGVIGVLVVVEVVLLGAFGFVAFVVLQLSSEPRWLRDVVVATFTGCVLGAFLWLVEAGARVWWAVHRPSGISLAVAPSGLPATAVHRSPAALVTPLFTAVLLPIWAVAMAFVSRPTLWLSVFFGLVALGTLARLAPFVLRRVRAGGLFLTADAVEHRFGVRTTRLPWTGLVVPPLEAPLRFPRTNGVTETRSFPVDIPTDVTDHVPADLVGVSAACLALPSPEVLVLLDLYASQPHLREHLGTPRSLEWRR